ncbi:unnamed protein product [Chironomus riparius]|uniref:Uncharacterized protein n=1 Tax=Chironomus riparius TaxID=315576 RepID=A0A9N9S754_9DIPT|nr:unnamed protein product [Chironomus riparius]
MKVPTVSKFLWCFDLTTGGLFLGYVGAVTNAGCALALLYELVADTDEFEEEVFEFAEEVEPVDAFVEGIIGHKANSRRDLPFWAILFIAGLWIGLLVMCSVFSVWFVQGVNNRDPQKVRYFLIIMIIGTVSSFFKGMLSLSFWWILFGMLNVYFIICVYSLYQILQYEDVEQVKTHATAYNQGYSQCYDEPETHHDEESVNGEGYQTTAFNEP